jgi:hypothetical protein
MKFKIMTLVKKLIINLIPYKNDRLIRIIKIRFLYLKHGFE